METFDALLAVCEGNRPRPTNDQYIMSSLGVFFDVNLGKLLNKRLSCQ